MEYISDRKISLPHSHRHQASSVNVHVNTEVDCRRNGKFIHQSCGFFHPVSLSLFHLICFLSLLYRYIGAISPSLVLFLIVCKSHWPLPRSTTLSAESEGLTFKAICHCDSSYYNTLACTSRTQHSLALNQLYSLSKHTHTPRNHSCLKSSLSFK